MKDNPFAQDQNKLLSEPDEMKFVKFKDKLIKNYGKPHRAEVARTLMRWLQGGKHPYLRADIVLDLLDLVPENDETAAEFFAWAIADPDLAYWSIDGLLKTKGNAGYREIVAATRNTAFSVETRAKAIKSLAQAAQQPFDRGLPPDPGNWSAEDLRLDEVERWERDGYPEGRGHQAPPTHPALAAPATEFERVVAKLGRRLAQYRAANQDPAAPTNWLTIAAPKDLDEIRKRWTLPVTYLDFLRRFSPLNVLVQGKAFVNGLHLYGAHDLLQGQDGYARNPTTGRAIAEWPKDLVVVGHDGADPFCIDCS